MAKSRARKFAELLDGSDNIKSARLTNAQSDLVDDTSPQLGGNLDLNGNNITGTGNIPAANLTGSLPAIDGSSLTGVTSVGGDTGVDFNDSVKAQFGAGDDLQIYHDGSNSYIHENGTGSLNILATDQIKIGNSANSEVYAKFNSNGNVELRYDNNVKFETKSTGVNVTGNVEVGGSRGITAVSGDYGSVQTVGGKGGWSGYSLGTKPYVLMTNNTHWGLYDDNVNAWTVYYDRTNRYLYTMAEGSDNLRVNLTQGSCKMWNTMENAGSVSTYDSYNVSSTVDQGVVGHYTLNFSNSFNNTAYSATAGASENGTATDNYARITSMATNRRATSYSRHWSHESWTGTNRDLTYICDHHMGDLA